MEETSIEAAALQLAHCASVAVRQNRLRPVRGDGRSELADDDIEGLTPADAGEFPPALGTNAAQRVQEHYLAGRKADAAAAIPTEVVEQVALVGPVSKVRRDLDTWSATVVDEIAVQGLPEDLDTVAAALL